MSMTSESEERMINGGPDSPYLDDANSAGGNGQLKKGPWTAQEDQILIDYVMKNGEGNWNAVQKQSGLLRCGKSCRLRWANHLRPDLKKGAFTPEEERCIAELHAKMGNKWAKMAAELPGRTDNEIKNYWNTRIKRRQRAGLPIYPSDICSEALNESHHNDINSFCSGSRTHQDFTSCNNFEIPDFEYKSLELRRQLYPPTFLDIPASAMLDIPKNILVGPSSYPNNSLVHPLKRHRGSPSFFHDCNAAIIGATQYPFVLSSSYEHNSNSNHVSTSAAFSGSHAAVNGNPCSSSEPAWAMMKKELPSLQNHMDSWAPQPPSPLPTENIQSSSISPRNSGLLDAVLYESHSLGNQKNFSMPSINGDVIMDCSSHQAQWEVAYGSRLGHSPSPVFSDGSPISFDKAQFADTARDSSTISLSNQMLCFFLPPSELPPFDKLHT